MTRLDILQKIIIGVSILFLILSLMFPCYYISGQEATDNNTGWALFLMGWSAFIIGYFKCFPWLANPFFLLALYYFIKGAKRSIIFSLMAFLFALSFLSFDTILIDENGTVSKIISLGLGYKLWLTTMAFMLIGTIMYFLFSAQILKSKQSL